MNSDFEDLFCGSSSPMKATLLFSYFSLLCPLFQSVRSDFQHHCAYMTDKADGSLVLIELQVSFLWECDNEWLCLRYLDGIWYAVETSWSNLWHTYFLIRLAFKGLLVGCLMSQQHASASQRQICSDKFICCHTEIVVADQTFCLTKSQYTDTGPTSLSADHMTPDTRQGSLWSSNFLVTGMTQPGKIPMVQGEIKPCVYHFQGRRLKPLGQWGGLFKRENPPYVILF